MSLFVMRESRKSCTRFVWGCIGLFCEDVWLLKMEHIPFVKKAVLDGIMSRLSFCGERESRKRACNALITRVARDSCGAVQGSFVRMLGCFGENMSRLSFCDERVAQESP